jgi:hypothetical protein
MPNAFVRRPGDAVLNQSAGVTAIDGAPLPHLQVSLGSAWPVWYAEDAGWNALATAKVGFSVGDHLHLAAGAHAFVAQAGSAVFLFAAATIGTPDLNVSVYAGPPLAASAAAGRFGDRVVALSGSWRFVPSFALVTEHWVGLDGGGSPFAGAIGVRALRRRGSIDAGVMKVPASGGLLPWVGFALALALPKEVTP